MGMENEWLTTAKTSLPLFRQQTNTSRWRYPIRICWAAKVKQLAVPAPTDYFGSWFTDLRGGHSKSLRFHFSMEGLIGGPGHRAVAPTVLPVDSLSFSAPATCPFLLSNKVPQKASILVEATKEPRTMFHALNLLRIHK
jgi:hypothetical protein